MNKKAVALAALVVGMAGYLAYSKYNGPWRPSNVNAAAIELARQTLKDPESSKFRDVRQSSAAVCGEVNAKNSFGAYTGFKRFYVTKSMDGRVSAKSRILLELNEDVEDFDQLYQLACQSA